MSSRRPPPSGGTARFFARSRFLPASRLGGTAGRKTGPLVYLPILLFGLVVASLSAGAMRIPFAEVAVTLLGFGEDTTRMVVFNLRMPRVAAAALVGAAMAVSGAIMQGVFRNSLASPDLLGIGGGASVAAVAFMTVTAGAFSIHWLPLVAAGGAFAAAALIYVLAWRQGADPFRMVLIGIGISTATAALTTFLLLSGPAHLALQVLNWLTGTVYGTSKQHVAALLPWIAILLPLACAKARHLDVLSLGDPAAIGLGSAVHRTRLALLALGVAMAGAAVGIAGAISFIGLMAPHMARRLAGIRYALVIPVSALVGAILLVLADLAGRLLFAPLDLPAGVFTAAFGAPFFFYLLYAKRRVSR